MFTLYKIIPSHRLEKPRDPSPEPQQGGPCPWAAGGQRGRPRNTVAGNHRTATPAAQGLRQDRGSNPLGPSEPGTPGPALRQLQRRSAGQKGEGAIWRVDTPPGNTAALPRPPRGPPPRLGPHPSQPTLSLRTAFPVPRPPATTRLMSRDWPASYLAARCAAGLKPRPAGPSSQAALRRLPSKEARRQGPFLPGGCGQTRASQAAEQVSHPGEEQRCPWREVGMDGTSLSPSQRPRPRGSPAALPRPTAELSLRPRG